jgi:hypothetical protein
MNPNEIYFNNIVEKYDKNNNQDEKIDIKSKDNDIFLEYSQQHKSYKFPDLIPNEIKLNCMLNFLKSTNPNNFKYEICCVCDERNFATQYQKFDINYLIQFKDLIQKKNLNYYKDLSNYCFKYDIPFKKLDNMVLSKNGFDHKNKKVNICNKCNKSLICNKLPKFR